MSNSYIRLTPSLDSKGNLVVLGGLIQFRLGHWVNGAEVDNVTVNSGGLGRQEKVNLRTFSSAKSVAGSLEPIPEGNYGVGPYEFAQPNDYGASWGNGLGPVWFEIIPKSAGNRGEFGIHLDANRDFSPGSAGCIVAPNLTILRKIIEWQKASGFSQLVVDYGLGTVEKPKTVSTTASAPKPAEATSVPFKIDANGNGLTITFLGDVKAGESFQLFSNSPSWTGKLVPKAK